MPTSNTHTPLRPTVLSAQQFLQWLGLALAALCLVSALPASAAAAGYFVSPSGSDSAAGTSVNTPFKTLQKALDVAQPGDVITLAAGVYAQDFQSRRSGTASAPITIKGPADAVVKGGGGARIGQINHDYLTLDGFTLDGLFGSATSASGYRDKLLYVIGTAPRDGVTGLKLLRMTFRNAGGECVRLRYFAQRNEVTGSRIGPCGVHDFRFAGGSKNGEGIYIGTAPEQRSDGKNPTSDVDESNGNWIHDNVFDTQGNECVDVKEGATANMIENNRCTGQKDPESGGFDSRGSGNIFRYNESFGNSGAGVRLGGDTASDGINNEVYGNSIHDNKAGGIKVQASPQRQVCGNPMSGNVGGDSVGTYRTSINPTAPCGDSAPLPTATPKPTTAPTATPAPAAPTATPAPAAPTATPVPAAPTATPASPGGSGGVLMNLAPVADTYANQGSPNSTCGACATLPVTGGTARQAFLRFAVGGLSARPTQAKLRLVVGAGSTDGSDSGGAINLISNNSWTESLTWNTRPAIDGPQVASLGAVNAGQVIEIDVTSLIGGNGSYSFAITSGSTNAVVYASNNSSVVTSRPQLIITP